METIQYNVGELKRLIRESSNEFKPKFGNGVEKSNKSKSEKSNSKKNDSDYSNGTLKSDKEKRERREDYNKTMFNLNPVNDVTKDYKDRVKAQVLGYTSKQEMENGSDKNADFSGNEEILKDLEANRDKSTKEKETFAKSGLQARELPDSDLKKNTLTEGKVAPKRLTFKKRFINESNMLQRIPDEYKVDGQVIYMNDRYDNEYIVECVKSEKSGFIETNVVGYNNKKKLDEQVSRMYQLFDFEPDCGKVSSSDRVNESYTFGELMDIARGNKK